MHFRTMMTETEFRSRRRARLRWTLLGLTLLCSLSFGCVYLRLLQLRKQLADFDANFTLIHSPGAYLTAKNPVLKPRDLVWLTGLDSVQTESTDGKEVSTFRFLKIDPPDGDLPRHSAAWMKAGFVKGKLQSIEFPETFNETFNHEVLRRAFHGAESGEVDESEKATGWALHKDLVIPDRPKIHRLFGLPSSTTTDREFDELLYLFHRPPIPKSEIEKPDMWFRFIYDRGGDKMIRAHVQVGWLQIVVSKGDDDQYRVRIRRGKYESP